MRARLTRMLGGVADATAEKRSLPTGQDLAKGKFKSCGCLNAERIAKHGMARTEGIQGLEVDEIAM